MTPCWWTVRQGSGTNSGTGGGPLGLAVDAGRRRRRTVHERPPDPCPNRPATDRPCPHSGGLFHRIAAVIHTQGAGTVPRGNDRASLAAHDSAASIGVDQLPEGRDV